MMSALSRKNCTSKKASGIKMVHYSMSRVHTEFFINGPTSQATVPNTEIFGQTHTTIITFGTVYVLKGMEVSPFTLSVSPVP